MRFARTPERPLGNWEIFLNVLNVGAEDGVAGRDLRRVLYGNPAPEDRFDTIMSGLYVQILRPLCWTGLLDETGERISAADRVFAETPLWRAALRLTTDSEVRSAVRH